MMKMTITEALAEVKIIDKKILSQNEYISQNVGRTSVMSDPLEKSGGSQFAIQKAFQSISDLNERKVKIRSVIQQINCVTKVVIGEKTKTISEFLNWKREVAPSYIDFLKKANQACQQMKVQFERQPQILKDAEGKQTIIQPVFHIDLDWLHKELEKTETMLGELDGKLSLLNATTFVEF
jgi:hypothetical protein